ncbi:hypothetical protein BKA93DRAFT_824328 [Sparassis latifolia]
MEALAVNEIAVAMVEAPSIAMSDGFGDGSTSGDLHDRDFTPIDAGGETVLAAPDVDDDFVWPTSPRPELVSLPDVSSDVQQGVGCNELPPIDIRLVGFAEPTKDLNAVPEASGSLQDTCTPIAECFSSIFLSDW